jgi:hypothetical protein
MWTPALAGSFYENQLTISLASRTQALGHQSLVIGKGNLSSARADSTALSRNSPTPLNSRSIVFYYRVAKLLQAFCQISHILLC